MHDSSKQSNKWNVFLYFTAGTVNLLSFASGNAYSWSSPVIPMLNSYDTNINPLDRPTTEIEDSWISSLISLGASIGPFIGGYLSEKIGRKKTLLLCSLPMISSHIIIFFSFKVSYFYALRILFGIGAGVVFSVVPVYIGEISEISNRGLLGCTMTMMCSIGILFCYAVGPFVSINVLSIICLVPLITNLFVFSIFIPESPYYLISVNKEVEAEKSLKKLRVDNIATVRKELEIIKKNIEVSHQETTSLKEAFKSKVFKKALTISVGLMFIQQFSGITAILAYLQTIFSATGTSLPSHISSIITASIQSICVFISLQLVDKLGRKVLLLFSCTTSGLSLGVLGFYYHLRDSGLNVDHLKWLPMASLLGFIISFNLGLCAVPWAISGELFPPSLKSLGSTLASFTCLFVAFLTTMFFPTIASSIGMAASFWIFAGFCLFGSGFVLYFVPETKGKSFEEIYYLLEK